MTYCSTIAKPLLRKIKAGKTLDKIGAELCGDSVKNPRQKAVRLIRELLGEETLIQHAETLKYDVGMADLSRKRKAEPQRKNAAGKIQDNTPECDGEQETTVVQAVRVVVDKYGYNPVMEALVAIQPDTPTPTTGTEGGNL